jgi:hypothetical protein
MLALGAPQGERNPGDSAKANAGQHPSGGDESGLSFKA